MRRLVLVLASLAAACSSSPPPPPVPAGALCSLPGTIQYTAKGVAVVPGGLASAPDLTWLQLPQGFCAHYLGDVPHARQLRVAPGGELFVASPSTYTNGGFDMSRPGMGAIAVLPDDNHDGYADQVLTYTSVASVQGLLFTPGYFYYQDDSKIMRVPYAKGDRTPSGTPVQVADVTIYTSGDNHWPKNLDQADDGTIYVTNGGSQGEQCDLTRPFHGGVLALDGSAGGTPVAKGFRNPIALRCARGHDRCFAIELGMDGSAGDGGREKVVPVRAGDDWGYPCCASQNLPYACVSPPPSCATTPPESVSLTIGDTPFGLDFEPGKWPAPWSGRAFIALHGVVGTWEGERITTAPMDPTTGDLVTSSDLQGSPAGGLKDFATGWGPSSNIDRGRVAEVTFAPDGRLYVANDFNGVIFWVAPLSM